MLKVNEQTAPYQDGIRLKDLVDTYKPGADLFIVNGFPALHRILCLQTAIYAA
jgi:ATP-dependent RNA circularization protein (DNA/RNA ligase family)